MEIIPRPPQTKDLILDYRPNRDSLLIYDTGPPSKIPEPPIPDKIAGPNPHMCDRCGNQFKDDIFCNWHGPVMGQWFCDDCTAELWRGSIPMEVVPAVYKKPMDERLIRMQLDVLDHAIRNLAEIKWVECHDPGGHFRNVDLSLDFRESRVVYKILRKVLKYKLRQNESFPA